MDYNNCLLLGDVIGKLLSGKGSISPIEKLYPRLFADRAEMEKQITAEEDLEFQRQMASFKAFTQVYNIQHNGGST